jgi:hypothetical protein
MFPFFQRTNRTFFLSKFCHAKHVKVPPKTIRLQNKLFYARNDYGEEDDQKSQNEKAKQPWQKR